MKLNQKEILLNLHYKKNDGIIYENNPYDFLIHSVLNTIKFKSLVKVYIYNELQELNTSIFSNLNNRVKSEDVENTYEYLKELIESKNNTYHFSQRLRKTLDILLLNLPNDYKIDFFNTYFYSKYLNDKKSAIKYIDYSQKNVDKELLELYISTKNNYFLNPILNRKKKKFVTNNFFKIWHTDLKFYYKKKIIETIFPLKSNIEIFIKNEEPDVYFHLQLLNNKITIQDFINKIESTEEDKRTIYISQASKHVKFEILEEIIKKYIS